MRRLSQLVFDDFIAYTGTSVIVYSADDHNDALGMYDRLSVEAIVDQSTGGATTIQVQLEHSNDERNWSVKTSAGTFLVNSATLAANTTKVFVGSDTDTSPTLGKVRFKITLSGSAAGQAHLKLYATVRDGSA